MKDNIRYALRKRLLSIMREISQSHFCAGWMMGLEYSLWQAVLQFPKSYEFGFGPIKRKNVKELKDLAEELQEWAIWDAEHGEKLIPLSDWKQIYAPHGVADTTDSANSVLKAD